MSNALDLRGALREDALFVAVQRNGEVWLDKSSVRPDQLVVAIRARLRTGAERKLYIRADARAKYRTVVEVLESARTAGVENVAFVLDQRTKP